MIRFSPSQLAYFVEVAEAGQISRAARTLYIAQPALSQSISRLERQVGVDLLVRHPRGVSLTPAGAVFLEKAKLAIHAEADALATALALEAPGRRATDLVFVHYPVRARGRPPIAGHGGVQSWTAPQAARSRSASTS